jgi:hypothetical protein
LRPKGGTLRLKCRVLGLQRHQMMPIKNKKSAPKYILKVVITTQKKSALSVKRHLHTCHNCINKEASASFRYTHTCSSRSKFEAAVGEGRREREAHSWERTFCICLSYLLALYWLSILRKFCWVFSPMRVSQDK